MVTLKKHPHAPSIRYFEIGGVRHYVKKTSIRTYVVATCWPFTLDDMVEIGGEYHFSTLAELRAAIEKGGA